MSHPIPVTAIAEDLLLSKILVRLLDECGDKYALRAVQVKQGTSDIDPKLKQLNKSAGNQLGNIVYIIFRDMDTLAHPQDPSHCPQSKIQSLLQGPPSPNFLLRLAVAESENWLLADHETLCDYLGVKPPHPPLDPDTIKNGKESLIALAKQSKKYRHRIAPQTADRKIGIEYNDALTTFIHTHWNPSRAAKKSKSLHRTRTRLRNFTL